MASLHDLDFLKIRSTFLISFRMADGAPGSTG